jgi:hypothetical protein
MAFDIVRAEARIIVTFLIVILLIKISRPSLGMRKRRMSICEAVNTFTSHVYLANYSGSHDPLTRRMFEYQIVSLA